MSEKLGISERSLDRLLAREGVRFSELAGLQRLEKAKSALRRGETVDRAAEITGYSDARSFRRAFQKATGLSPGGVQGHGPDRVLNPSAHRALGRSTAATFQ